jgi:DNA helicase II / ATP-dependent DNA helicase PcrA
LKASSGIIQETMESLKGFQDGVEITIAPQKTDKSEAEFVARTIEKMVGGVRFFSMDSDVAEGDQAAGIESLSDFAVLCRTKSLMPALAKAFNDHSIPFQLSGVDRFFTDEPVVSILNVLKFIMAPSHPFFKQAVNPKIQNSSALRDIQERLKTQAVSITIKEIVTAFYGNDKSSDEPVEKLIGIAEDYQNDYDAFVRMTELGTETDTVRLKTERVNVMTLHASKGLEFECVFIIGCEVGYIPFKHPTDPTDVEEERRLLYVGMTRAKKYIFLTHAENRILYGKSQGRAPSPFLKNIKRELIRREKSELKAKVDKDRDQIKLWE